MRTFDSYHQAKDDYMDSVTSEYLILHSSDNKHTGKRGERKRFKDFLKQRQSTDMLLQYMTSFEI